MAIAGHNVRERDLGCNINTNSQIQERILTWCSFPNSKLLTLHICCKDIFGYCWLEQCCGIPTLEEKFPSLTYWHLTKLFRSSRNLMYSWCSSAVLSSINSSANVLSTPRSARKSIKWSYRAWKQETGTFLSKDTWSGIAFTMSHGSWHFFLPEDQATPQPLLSRPGLGCNIWREGAMEQVIQTPSCEPKPIITNELHFRDENWL